MPTAYLKRLYFDTIVYTHHQLEYLVDQYGADHVLMGTDYPADMGEIDPIGFVEGARGSTTPSAAPSSAATPPGSSTSKSRREGVDRRPRLARSNEFEAAVDQVRVVEVAAPDKRRWRGVPIAASRQPRRSPSANR